MNKMELTLRQKLGAVAVCGFLGFTPAVPASAQSSAGESDFCTDAPAVCLLAAVWVTWQVIKMSEPGSDSASAPYRGGEDDGAGSRRDGTDHSSDYGCAWGSRKYDTCH